MPTHPAAPSFQPLYLQIKALLQKSLEVREWGPGKAIPSEIELAGRFGVSQGTVRKAIDALAADNLVVRRQGKGTFVATHTEERASMFRFLRIRRDDGRSEYPASRLVDLRRGKAGVESARLLELKQGDAVLILRRVLEWGGAPVVLDEMTLPAALFRGLTRARYDAYHGSMYGFFETQFGVRILRAREKLADQWLGFGEEELSAWLLATGFTEVCCERLIGGAGQEDVLLVRATHGIATEYNL